METDTRAKELRLIAKIIVLLAGLTGLFFVKLAFNPSKILIAADLINYHVFVKRFALMQFQRTGSLPLWNPLVFSGTPFVANIQSSCFYPFYLPFLFLPPESLMGPIIAFHYFWAAVGAFLLARFLVQDNFSALFSAAAFAFCGKTASHLLGGHLPLVVAMSWVPWTFYAAELLLRRPSLSRAAFLGCCLSMELLSGHPQMVHYTLMFLALFFVFRLVIHRPETSSVGGVLHRGAFGALALAFMIGLCCVQLLPSIELASEYVNRSGGLGVSFSAMHQAAPRELWTLLLPRSMRDMGGAGDLWFWEHNGYLGALPLMFAVVAVIGPRREKMVWFFAGMAVVALLLSLGTNTPLFSIAYHLVPGFKLFRVPPRMLFFFVFAASVLAGYGIKWFKNAGANHLRTVLKVAIVVEFILLALYVRWWLFTSAIPRSFWRPVLALSCVAILCYFLSRNALRLRTAQAILLCLLVVDLFSYGSPMLMLIDKKQIDKPTSSTLFIANDSSPFRILDFAPDIRQETAVRYGIQSVAGYDPIILRKYMELYAQIWNDGKTDYWEMPWVGSSNVTRFSIINLLNVKYIITRQRLDRDDFPLLFSDETEPYRPVFVHENLYVLPRVFAAPDFEIVPDLSARLARLREINPARTVLLEEDPGIKPSDYEKDMIPGRVTKYEPDAVTFEIDLPEPRLVVLSDVWYPGWKATDNGRPAKVIIADHALRGIPLQAGHHVVELVFEQESYKRGKVVTLLSLLVLGLVFIGSAIRFARLRLRKSA